MDRERLPREGTRYAPSSPPPATALRCAWCGRPEGEEGVLLVATADGSAAICDECNAQHARFFARRRERQRR
jgi:hypothetical protein